MFLKRTPRARSARALERDILTINNVHLLFCFDKITKFTNFTKTRHKIFSKLLFYTLAVFGWEGDLKDTQAGIELIVKPT